MAAIANAGTRLGTGKINIILYLLSDRRFIHVILCSTGANIEYYYASE